MREKRSKPEKRVKPETVGRVVSQFLKEKGLSERVLQASSINVWAGVVGPQIASVTRALSVTQDGTLFVSVTTNAWMTELSLMEPELIRALNSHLRARSIKKIRFQLKR